MAKSRAARVPRKSTYIAKPEPNLDTSGELPVFTPASGKKVIIKGVSPMMVEKIQASVPFPSPPTYEAETASGDIEKHAHDETTLETDDDREAWDQYLLDRAEAGRILQERMYRLMFLRGIELVEPMPDTWVEEQEWLGLTVPENPAERKQHYIETEVIGNAQDLTTLMELVMRQSGLPEEVLAEARQSFQRALEGQNSAEESVDKEGQLEGK